MLSKVTTLFLENLSPNNWIKPGCSTPIISQLLTTTLNPKEQSLAPSILLYYTNLTGCDSIDMSFVSMVTSRNQSLRVTSKTIEFARYHLSFLSFTKYNPNGI